MLLFQYNFKKIHIHKRPISTVTLAHIASDYHTEEQEEDRMSSLQRSIIESSMGTVRDIAGAQ